MGHQSHYKISKFLSLVLRHKPEQIGIILNSQGWTSVKELILKVQKAGIPLTQNTLEQIVETNEKKRFEFNSLKTHIRASQGHSVPVDLEYISQTPPDILYHGTTQRSVNSILREGLKKMERHHVHLSSDQLTATTVGSRRGECVLFEVAALEMFQDGFEFFQSSNGVWLTNQVPARYLILK